MSPFETPGGFSRGFIPRRDTWLRGISGFVPEQSLVERFSSSHVERAKVPAGLPFEDRLLGRATAYGNIRGESPIGSSRLDRRVNRERELGLDRRETG